MKRPNALLAAALSIGVLCLLSCGDDDPASSRTEEMTEAHDSIVAALNSQDVDAYMAHYADDVVWDNVPLQPAFTTKAGVRGFMTPFLQAFPDFHTAPQQTLISGSTLVSETFYTGTLQQEWLGIPAAGQVVQGMGILEIYDFDGDMVTGLTIYWDAATLMTLLGVLPASELPSLVPSIALPEPEGRSGMSVLDLAVENDTRFNSHDMATWSKGFASDVDIRYSTLMMMPLGRDALIALNELFILGFPDLRLDLIRRLDLGDGWVCSEYDIVGTHDGPYFGIPATGTSTDNRLGIMTRIEDSLITEMHVYFDNMTVLRGMGVVP